MPPMHPFMGFGIIPTILQAALVIAFVWLMIKFGRVLDAYSVKLKAKTWSPSTVVSKVSAFAHA